MSESPAIFAKRIGIARKGHSGKGLNTAISWDDCLDLAVTAYWHNRPHRPAVTTGRPL